MSLLVKGMEMPKHCIDCPFMVSRGNDDCILQSAETNARFENWEQMKANCPLVEVPPHGRLIDADALADVSAKRLGVINIGHIDDAPTIIPAEEKK